MYFSPWKMFCNYNVGVLTVAIQMRRSGEGVHFAERLKHISGISILIITSSKTIYIVKLNLY